MREVHESVKANAVDAASKVATWEVGADKVPPNSARPPFSASSIGDASPQMQPRAGAPDAPGRTRIKIGQHKRPHGTHLPQHIRLQPAGASPWSTCAITDMLRICFGLSMMVRSCVIVKFTCTRDVPKSNPATTQHPALRRAPRA